MEPTLKQLFEKLKAESGETTDTAFAEKYLFGMTKSEYDKLKNGAAITRAWRIALLFLQEPGALAKLREWNEKNAKPKLRKPRDTKPR